MGNLALERLEISASDKLHTVIKRVLFVLNGPVAYKCRHLGGTYSEEFVGLREFHLLRPLRLLELIVSTRATFMIIILHLHTCHMLGLRTSIRPHLVSKCCLDVNDYLMNIL